MEHESLKIYSNYLKLLGKLSIKGMIKPLNLAHDQEWVMNYFCHDGRVGRKVLYRFRKAIRRVHGKNLT
jgi:hypothetical protein